jgi:MarR family transcriptional regulator, organic hydroperoxide resistance regulator
MTAFPPTLEFLRRLWQLNHALERRSSQMQQELGITAQQRMVLRCLGWLGPVHAGRLAEVLHLDPGTLSATLRRLEERGLVRRERDGADSRRVRIVLTDSGHALDVPTPRTVEAVVERLLECTPSDEMASTARVLERFAELLELRIASPLPASVVAAGDGGH